MKKVTNVFMKFEITALDKPGCGPEVYLHEIKYCGLIELMANNSFINQNVSFEPLFSQYPTPKRERFIRRHFEVYVMAPVESITYLQNLTSEIFDSIGDCDAASEAMEALYSYVIRLGIRANSILFKDTELDINCDATNVVYHVTNRDDAATITIVTNKGDFTTEPYPVESLVFSILIADIINIPEVICKMTGLDYNTLPSWEDVVPEVDDDNDEDDDGETLAHILSTDDFHAEPESEEETE